MATQVKILRAAATGGLSFMLAFSLTFAAVPPAARAQAQAPAPAAGSTTSSSGGPRKQLATIIYAGLGGAILGLSTLSFYGRPQEKLSNIAIGFAFGVIAGTVVVTYKAMNNPSEFYGLRPRLEREQEFANRMSPPPEPQVPLYAWQF